MTPIDGYLLDTNVISRVIRGQDATRAKVQRMPQARLRVCTIVIAELEYGSLNGPEPDRHRSRWRRFLDGITVIGFDQAAALEHARLRRLLRQQPVGERDLLIASIAMAHRLGVATNNVCEFARIPGLRCEDWTLG